VLCCFFPIRSQDRLSARHLSPVNPGTSGPGRKKKEQLPDLLLLGGLNIYIVYPADNPLTSSMRFACICLLTLVVLLDLAKCDGRELSAPTLTTQAIGAADSPKIINEKPATESKFLRQPEVRKDDDSVPVARTATGGFINTIMVFLSIFAFVGNGAFMVYVFWLSK
jgi:hypothetical protein